MIKFGDKSLNKRKQLINAQCKPNIQHTKKKIQITNYKLYQIQKRK